MVNVGPGMGSVSDWHTLSASSFLHPPCLFLQYLPLSLESPSQRPMLHHNHQAHFAHCKICQESNRLEQSRPSSEKAKGGLSPRRRLQGP